MKAIKDKFWQGAFWATSNQYRMHNDSVGAQEMLNEFGNQLAGVARAACEYDVAPLRRLNCDLPMGCDANYTGLHVAGYSLDGDITSNDDDAFEFAVRANRDGETVSIASFPEREPAEAAVKVWNRQLQSNAKRAR